MPELPEAETVARALDRAELTLDDGRVIRFNDPRRFGSLEVQRCGPDGWPESLAGIGVEPLSDAFTGEVLFKASAAGSWANERRAIPSVD